MPELPEVETTRRGIAPHILDQVIERVDVRQPKLRWPVSADLDEVTRGQRVLEVNRRGKYLLLMLKSGAMILHLGMSGSLRLLQTCEPPGRHDHLDICFSNQRVLRLNDPRRFGAVLWTDAPLAEHPLLRHLGPEPLDTGFSGDHLHGRSRGRRVAIKNFIMNSRIVVGVGNIYASESLFRAKIDPRRNAGKVSRNRYIALADAIQSVLLAAIEEGGTSLRDFTDGDGKAGYFGQRLRVYGRADEPCVECGCPIRQIRIGQRASYYCPGCQR